MTARKTKGDPAVESPEMTIEEFCTALSMRDQRVELIGAFHTVESRKGNLKDTEAAFQARFEKFGNQPA